MVKRSKDKRKNQRQSCRVPVDGKGGGAFDSICTVDFSKRGLGFISKKKISQNKRIAVQLELTSDDDPVFVIGCVKWAHPIMNSDHYRIGMTFEDLLRGSKTRLDKYFQK